MFRKVKSKYFVIFATLVVISFFIYHNRLKIFSPQMVDRPNIVMILADTLRPDFLGCYGFQGNISPNIDKIAKQGILFENAFSQAPWTKPAIASLMTSLYPSAHKVIDHENLFSPSIGYDQKSDILDENAQTLPELLKKNGYKTLAYIDNHPWLEQKFGLLQGTDHYEQRKISFEFKSDPESINNLLEHVQSKPFFLYIHLMTAHGPYLFDNQVFNQLIGSPSLGKDRILTVREWNRMPSYLKSTFSSENEYRYLRNWKCAYAAQIPRLDKMVGKIWSELSKRGILNETIFILTSDHGESFLEHGVWEHGRNLHSELLRVPLLIRFPNSKYKGSKNKKLVSLIDLMPTLLKITNSKFPTYPISGIDIFSNKRNDEKLNFATAVYFKPHQSSVHSLKEKLILDQSNNFVEYFDLKKDKLEKINKSFINHEEVELLVNHLYDHLKSSKKLSLQVKGKHLGDSTDLIEKLKSIGYVN